MINHKITVFTSTFNRRHTLPRLYESLLAQTVPDFTWLVIDDGSTDNTRELVQEWADENKISIQYIYQSNHGMLGGHNTAYDNITTELNVCIDSDDFMPKNAIERILYLWEKYGDNNLAGIVGLDSFINGEIIGDEFPSEGPMYFHDIIDKFRVRGDKKYVYRTSVINEFPRYPHFEGEKFPAQSYLYRLISQKYPLLPFNEIFCVVEYLPDGNSKNKYKSYRQNANGFAYYRQEMMSLSHKLKHKFRHAIHYVSSCIFARKSIFYGKHFWLIFFAIPFGTVLNLYLRFTKKKGVI